VLKTRVIPTLLHKDATLVKGVGFDSWRPIGSAMQAVRVFNLRDVDELVFLDIRATLAGQAPDYELIDELADACFMPLTVGGGVRTVEHAATLLRVGADKVALNSVCIEDPGVVSDIAERFGAQCVVASIDARASADGHVVVTRSGTRTTGRDPVSLAVELERRGAGELLVGSIDRDGTMQGYDLELIRRVSEAVGIPVIASGGGGTYAHMLAALREGGAAAVAAGAMWQFTEQTPAGAKRFLAEHGVPVRIPLPGPT